MPQGVAESYTTSGALTYSWYGSRKAFEIKERVTFSGTSSAGKALQTLLPPRCVIRWLTMKYNSTATFARADTNQASADAFALVYGALGTASVTVSTDIILVGDTTLTTAGVKRSASAANAAKGYNTATTEVSLYIYPVDSGGSNYFDANGTSGGYLTGTADLYVYIAGETFTDPPSS